MLPSSKTKLATKKVTIIHSDVAAAGTVQSSEVRLIYQFHSNGRILANTQFRDNFLCVYCKLNCGQLYSLMQHMRCFHSRYVFTCVVREVKLFYFC